MGFGIHHLLRLTLPNCAGIWPPWCCLASKGGDTRQQQTGWSGHRLPFFEPQADRGRHWTWARGGTRTSWGGSAGETTTGYGRWLFNNLLWQADRCRLGFKTTIIKRNVDSAIRRLTFAGAKQCMFTDKRPHKLGIGKFGCSTKKTGTVRLLASTNFNKNWYIFPEWRKKNMQVPNLFKRKHHPLGSLPRLYLVMFTVRGCQVSPLACTTCVWTWRFCS